MSTKEGKLRKMRDLADFQRELKDAGIDIAVLTEVPAAHPRPFSQLARGMIEHAVKHGFVLSPFGFGNYIDNVNEFHCCPCAPDRKCCPCPESVAEVNEKGCCLCRLFYKNYRTFLDLRMKTVIVSSKEKSL